LRRGAHSIAVDHRVAEHHRADAGSSEHQPVDRDTSGLIGVRLDWRRLGSNSRVRGKAAADLGWSPTRRSVTTWIANELT
jgi:hypothetical protein